MALKHVLASVTANSGLKSVTVSENSMSDGITETIISSDGEEGKLHRDVYTFLATGTDHSGNLTDVIMIAKFDTSNSRVDILQIPRDTFIRLNGKLIIDDSGNISAENFSASGYETKINAAFSTGKSFAKKPLNNLLSAATGKNASEIEKLCNSKEYSYLDVTQQQVTKYLNEKDNSKKKELFDNMQRNFGIKYLSTLIYSSYGIPIDYHAQVNTKGFRGIVDAIGGVDLYVPQNMYHNDPTQDLYINLKKGQQHLDGAKAEQFVRFRGYTLGDIDRIDAQKSFISAFLNKLFSPSTITKISQITSEVQKNLYTNLTLQETADFAVRVLEMDLANNFTMTTLPGRPVDVTRGDFWISYYSADKNAVMELVNKNFNKYDTDLPAEMFGLHMLSSSPAIIGTTVVGTDNTDITPESVVTSAESSEQYKEVQNVDQNPEEDVTPEVEETEETTAVQENNDEVVSDTATENTNTDESVSDNESDSSESDNVTDDDAVTESFDESDETTDTSTTDETPNVVESDDVNSDINAETETPSVQTNDSVQQEDPVQQVDSVPELPQQPVVEVPSVEEPVVEPQPQQPEIPQSEEPVSPADPPQQVTVEEAEPQTSVADVQPEVYDVAA